VVVVLLWLVNRFIAHAFTATIILISASFCPSTVTVNAETVYPDRCEASLVMTSTGDWPTTSLESPYGERGHSAELESRFGTRWLIWS
jgi:hypothetical protein